MPCGRRGQGLRVVGATAAIRSGVQPSGDGTLVLGTLAPGRPVHAEGGIDREAVAGGVGVAGASVGGGLTREAGAEAIGLGRVRRALEPRGAIGAALAAGGDATPDGLVASAESTGFAVADRAVEGNAAAALETLRWAFATGTDPVLVSAALAANLRTIGIVASAGRGSPDSLAGPLGMPAWKIRRAQVWAKRWRPEALAKAVHAVAIADADIKGEGVDAAYAAEAAVIAVADCVG